jgi:hypothetical protein
MKISFIHVFFFILFCVCPYENYGQTYSINNKNVLIQFEILDRKDSFIVENISISNNSKFTICIAEVKEISPYFFQLEKILFSNFGLMNSLYGAPPLGADALLRVIKPSEQYNSVIKIKTNGQPINQYVFSFDYIIPNKIELKKNNYNEKIVFKMEDYYNNCVSILTTNTSVAESVPTVK